jgi:hypothetical protein
MSEGEDMVRCIGIGLDKPRPVGIVATPSELSVIARHAADALMRALGTRLFMAIPKEGHELLLAAEAPFGKPIKRAFPSAASDVTQAKVCMAFELYTASVFHLMRAVEWALRALANDLGVKRIRTVKKPGKKAVYQPLSYAEWERILDGLHDAVDARIAKLKRGQEKQKTQEFYYPILQDIRAIKDAWRNHVMHARVEYMTEDAKAVFEHVKRLMTILSTRIREA